MICVMIFFYFQSMVSSEMMIQLLSAVVSSNNCS